MSNQIVNDKELAAIERSKLSIQGKALAQILLHVRDFVRESPNGKPIDTWTIKDIIELSKKA